MHINQLGLFSNWYRTLLSCLSMFSGSWVGVIALCREVGWHYTEGISAWYSMHQLPGCECTVNRSCTPLRHQNSAYLSIFGYMQEYIQMCECIYNLQIYIIYVCIILYIYLYLLKPVCFYVCGYIYIGIF